jgi:hypothetical protein
VDVAACLSLLCACGAVIPGITRVLILEERDDTEFHNYVAKHRIRFERAFGERSPTMNNGIFWGLPYPASMAKRSWSRFQVPACPPPQQYVIDVR